MRQTREEIIEQLQTVIVQNLELEVVGQLQETDRLYEELNIDSLMLLQLIVYVEEEFGVSVPEEDVDPAVFKTVEALVSFIQNLQSTMV